MMVSMKHIKHLKRYLKHKKGSLCIIFLFSYAKSSEVMLLKFLFAFLDD